MNKALISYVYIFILCIYTSALHLHYRNYAAYRRWSMHPPEDWRAVACEELKSRFRHDMGYRFEYYTKPAVAEGAGVGGDAKAKSS